VGTEFDVRFYFPRPMLYFSFGCLPFLFTFERDVCCLPML